MLLMIRLINLANLAWLLTALIPGCQLPQSRKVEPAEPAKSGVMSVPSVYETRPKHDPDGIGKFYLGREIAHVMGYQGAAWLERPDEVVAQMNLRPTDVAADIGAGTGYFSFRFVKVVREGKVYAVDVQPEMLSLLEEKQQQLGVSYVATVRSTETDARLPAGTVDVVFFADVYHEFAYP